MKQRVRRKVVAARFGDVLLVRRVVARALPKLVISVMDRWLAGSRTQQ